ncbi:MAG: serine hydrolase, partial [Sulfitobacter sp.]|nr:serine hydrolase [Sulfitobacter sp.]
MHYLSVFLFLWVGLAGPAISQEPFPHRKAVDALVQPYLDHRQMQGLSIGVTHKGKQWILHYGTRGESSGEKPNDRTVYEIGSISKVFTSLLLAHAVEQGNVKLDQSVGSLLP